MYPHRLDMHGELLDPGIPTSQALIMPGSAAYAAEVHAGQRVVIVDMVVDFRHAIVLRAGANQAQKHRTVWPFRVCWEERFARTGSVIRGLHANNPG